MLESMRNQAQSWIAKIILGGIALSFALWGIGDYFIGSQVETVAEVDGKPIADSQFYTAYERQLNNYRAMLGNQFSKELAEQFNVKEETLQTLINRKLMLDEAERMGLAAPESVLLSSLKGTPAFQSAGNFDPERYRIITRNMGYISTRDYEDEQRLNLMVDALQKAIVDSARINDNDIRDRFNSEFEKRVLAAVIVDPAGLAGGIKISDADAHAYYDAHQQNYRSPLRVKLNAVEISPKSFAADMTVDKAEVEAAYNDRKAEFVKPEKRRASHILVRLEQNADEATRAAARSKIEAAKARIDGGEDFAVVAKDVSEDSTADKGGDLGFFPRGAMVPEFDDAVYALVRGEVSDIIETQFGFHIIKLNEIEKEQVTPLADVYDKLADTIRLERAREEAFKLSADLDDALGMEPSLAGAAATLNLSVKAIGPVSADEALGDSLLASDPSLRVIAFSAMPGESVSIKELDDGRFVAIEVLERIEPATLPFAEAAAGVYEDARNDAARDKARSTAEEIAKRAGSESLDKLAQEFGQPKYISKPVRSNGIGDESDWITSEVLDQAFKALRGSLIASPVEVSKGIAVVQVADVMAPSEAEFEAQKESMRLEVEKSKGAVRFARWMATVRDNHEITVNRKVLDRF